MRTVARARAVLALSLLLGALLSLLAKPASAGLIVLDVSPTEGPVGTMVHASGGSCPDGGTLEGGAEFIFTIVTGPARSQLVQSGADGTFSTEYQVLPPPPGEAAPDNKYEITGSCSTNTKDVYDGGTFTLTGPTVLLSPFNPTPGSTVRLDGVGCVHDSTGPADGSVSMPGTAATATTFSALDNYTFSTDFQLPPDAPASGTITVTCLSQLRNGPGGVGGQMLTSQVAYPTQTNFGSGPPALPGANLPGDATRDQQIAEAERNALLHKGTTDARGYVGAKKVRSALSAAVRTPQDLPLSTTRVLVSAVIALALLLVVFPAELFNKTLEEHYDEVVGWLPWHRRRRGNPGEPAAPEQAPDPPSADVPAADVPAADVPAAGLPAAPSATAMTGLNRSAVLAVLAVATCAAILYSLVDPHAGMDKATVTAVIGVVLAIVVSTLLNGLPARRWIEKQYRAPHHLRAFPTALLVTVVCVLLSRALSFTPGYLYGIVAGFTTAAAVSTRDKGRAEAVGIATGLAVAYLAWLLRIPVVGRASHGGVGWLVLDALLAALFAGGLGGILFALVPLHSLPGSKLFAWSKLVWALFFGSSTFAFVLTLLSPAKGTGGAVGLTVLLFILFAAVSVGFWAYFRYRETPETPPPPAEPARATA
ncbi:MAG: hypothetical protein QOE64_711 [Frankiales bacterium]|nr:hypothetical protein [Frankiales bacterium]